MTGQDSLWHRDTGTQGKTLALWISTGSWFGCKDDVQCPLDRVSLFFLFGLVYAGLPKSPTGSEVWELSRPWHNRADGCTLHPAPWQPLDKGVFLCQYLFMFRNTILKSRIQETKHLSTDADSSTDTKKILLVRQSFQKKLFFLRGNFSHFISKSFQIWHHFFQLFFPKDSNNL